MSAPLIARARPEHVEGIRAIYNHAVRTSAASFDVEEKSREDRERWLTARSERHPVLVALDGAALLGWGSLSPYSERAAYANTVEDSVYVAESARGRGVGRALLAGLMDEARAQRHHAVLARIVGGNAVSVALHARFGFGLVGTLREVGWKFERWHDVVVMQAIV